MLDYLSFDVSWFTTLPGILITVGVILLLVGLIFYILSGKKDKGDNSSVTPEETKTVETAPVEAAPVDSGNATPTDANSNVVEAKQEPVDVVTAENASQSQTEVPTTSESTPVVDNTAVESANPVTPVASEPATPTPAVDVAPATPSEEEPQIVLEPAKPVVPPVVEIPAANPEENTVSIYGGANPQVSVEPVEEPRKVYGGADPLENTGALPRVEVPVEPAVQVETPVTSEPVPVVDNAAVTEEVKTEEKKPVTPADDVETLEF